MIFLLGISGNIGALIKIPRNNLKKNQYLFSEDQSRYIVEVKDDKLKEVTKILKENSIYFEKVGITQKNFIELENEFKISLDDLSKSYKYWFRNYFSESR